MPEIEPAEKGRVIARKPGSGSDPEKSVSWRVPASIVAFFGSVVTAMLWLFFFSDGFNILQNITMNVAIFLMFIAVLGATCASSGIKHGPPDIGIGVLTIGTKDGHTHED